MTFTEPSFWLLAIVAYVLWLTLQRDYRVRLGAILLCSLVFYGAHRWQLLPLLLAYCLVDWSVARWMERSRRPRPVLWLGIAFNLGVLAYFKYMPLFQNTAASLGLVFHRASADWDIPFGISFYAFTGIAYLVDVYRHVVPAERQLLRYSLSAVFFPHLVAGPILRPQEFLTQLTPESLPEPRAPSMEATFLIARGLFKKLVLADRIALAIDPFLAHVADASTQGVWSLPYIYLYAFQIYFDFSGYTDIARGLGLAFGFRWPENFDRPYLATCIQEFWARWHMTLSRFLKDYLYIPLGGNRRGTLRTNFNLLVTMLLGGLWHGAAWSFMIWGGLHGIFLVIHRLWSRSSLRARLPVAGASGQVVRMASIALTFNAVCLCWCFFRLTDWSASLACIRHVWEFSSDRMLAGGACDASLWLLLASYALAAWFAGRLPRWFWTLDLAPRLTALPVSRGFIWGFSVALVILALLLSPGGDRPAFIYFQF
jgi:D-alanyl-lipoteichoic acid acyltransferase DltB (MBOAT superfamily)